MSALASEPLLKSGLYRLPEDPIDENVLIPGFCAATSVRGAFGWFTAGWIDTLAHGLAEYLNRENTEPILFTVAPEFYPSERQAVEDAQNMTAEEATRKIADVFTQGRLQASLLGQHALNCLAWMLACNRLHLRVVVPTPESNYHPKIWLFNDGEHRVLVRGSANATGRGLNSAVEHMDVDVSWEDKHGASRVVSGVAMLNDWEQGKSQGIHRVVDMPEALKEGIIKTAPKTKPTVEDYQIAVAEEVVEDVTEDLTGGVAAPDTAPDDASEKLDALLARFGRTPRRKPPHTHLRTSSHLTDETDLQQNLANSSHPNMLSEPSVYHRPRMRIPEWLEWQTGAYAHQGEAVAAWENAGERGTISMATGAGKTLTALVCATRAQDRLHDQAMLIVISAPSVPLVMQWRREVQRFGVNPVTPTLTGTVRNTDAAITNLFRSLGAGGTHVVVITNHMLCSSAFQKTMSSKTITASTSVATMFIADEAHTLGAEGFINNKPEFFQRRLALSATPERQYDPDGTEEIFDFFGAPVYEFGIAQAIGFCLAPYDYYVHATALSDEELDEFRELTKKISKASARMHSSGTQINSGTHMNSAAYMSDSSDADELNEASLKRLLIMRRRIVETAHSKIELLRKVLLIRKPRNLKHTLIYASGKNPEQFDRIAATLTDLGVRWAPVTQEVTKNTRKLEDTLEMFQQGGLQVLLAKKVLDEGVDIPSIREAFIVASSTVEREWVQRRGRILRLHRNKTHAVLHDFVALPPTSFVRLADASDQDVMRIVSNELSRAYSFASHSRNSIGVNGSLTHLETIKHAYWPQSASMLASPQSVIGTLSRTDTLRTGASSRTNRFVMESAGDHFVAPISTELDNT